jgi:hypothetical protein
MKLVNNSVRNFFFIIMFHIFHSFMRVSDFSCQFMVNKSTREFAFHKHII